MKCKDVQSSIAEINLYCTGRPTGRALLVNAENYRIYQRIKAQLEVDSNKVFVYVSVCMHTGGRCKGQRGLQILYSCEPSNMGAEN